MMQLHELIERFQKVVNEGLDELFYMEWNVGTDYKSLVINLSKIVSQNLLSADVRKLAGLHLRNIICQETDAKNKRWLIEEAETRKIVKYNCFISLDTQPQEFHFAAQCVACIACLEIPVKEWLDIIQMLRFNITKAKATETSKCASLEALGYILEEIDPDLITHQSGDVLAGIVCGLKEEEKSTYIKKAAAKALLNSLDITLDVFKNQIIELVCKTVVNPYFEVAVIGLHCLNYIVPKYYGHLEPFMSEAIYSFTYKAMDHKEDHIVIAGISFWFLVCEKELELVRDYKRKNYLCGVVETLVPILVNILARRKEGEYYINNDDFGDAEDECEPYEVAFRCLKLLTETCGEMIVKLLVPYLKDNITHAELRFRYVAMKVFVTILKCPSSITIEPLVHQVMIVISNMLTDDSPFVRDAAAWTVSHVCRFVPELPLHDECLPKIMEASEIALTLEARVATHVCWALRSLAEGAFNLAFNEHNELQNYHLSPYFPNLVDKLLATADRSVDNQLKLQRAAFSAVMELITHAPQDCYGCIRKMTMILLEQLEVFLEDQSYSVDTMDKVKLDDLQIDLCGTLQTVLPKITQEDVLEITDNVMDVLIVIFDYAELYRDGSHYSGIQEDVLLTVDALIDSIGTHFNKRLNEFMFMLLHCLIKCTKHQIWINAIGVIRHLTRIMLKIEHFLPTIMKLTLRKLATERSLAPLIISTYGDFALYFRDAFSPYRIQVLEILKHICQADIDLNNPDILYDPNMTDCLIAFRRSSIYTFVGLIQGGPGSVVNKNVDRLSFILPYLPKIVEFVEHVGKQFITRYSLRVSCFRLVRDIMSNFGQYSLTIVNTVGINNLLNKEDLYEDEFDRMYRLLVKEELKKLKEGAPVL